MKEENKLPWIVLGIFLLLILSQTNLGTFSVMMGGISINATETNITGECWGFAQEDCVKKEVKLLNFTDTGDLICPVGFWKDKVTCLQQYGLSSQVSQLQSELTEEKQKTMCYRINEDKSICEEAGRKTRCGGNEFSSLSDCQTKLAEESSWFNHIKKLFTNPATLLLIIAVLVGIIYLLFIRK